MRTLFEELMYTSLYERLASHVTVNYDVNDTENRVLNALATRTRDVVTPEQLMKLWHIGHSTAKRTIKVSTHQCLHLFKIFDAVLE